MSAGGRDLVGHYLRPCCIEIAPDDGPSIAMLARVDDLKRNPPPENWDGAWRFEHK